MKVEIELLVRKLGLFDGDFDKDKDPDYKVRKAIYWPNGTVHSKYYMSFTTGEWVCVPPSCSIPDECLMNDYLRTLLYPKRPPFGKVSVSPKDRSDSEGLSNFMSRMRILGKEDSSEVNAGFIRVSEGTWDSLIENVKKLEDAFKATVAVDVK